MTMEGPGDGAFFVCQGIVGGCVHLSDSPQSVNGDTDSKALVILNRHLTSMVNTAPIDSLSVPDAVTWEFGS
jgi:hypothetical protein